MRIDYGECERRVLLSEGGYTNDPQDPGGPTNWGITLEDARLHWKPNATAEDVRAMPRSVAEGIYKEKYWDALVGDDLPAGVDYAVFDYGVNSGIGRSGRVLRAVLGLPSDDWHVGETVLSRLAQVDPVAVVGAVCAERMQFLHSLRTWSRFGGGWGRRVASVKDYADHLAKDRAGVAPPHPETNDPVGKAYMDGGPLFAEPIPLLPAFLRPKPTQPVTIEPVGSPLVRSSAPPATQLPPDAPAAQAPPSMLRSKTGWVVAGLGGSGALDGLHKLNDYASEVSMAKFSLAQLDLPTVGVWLLDHPLAFVPALVVAGAAFVWEDHRKYKRLLHEAQSK